MVQPASHPAVAAKTNTHKIVRTFFINREPAVIHQVTTRIPDIVNAASVPCQKNVAPSGLSTKNMTMEQAASAALCRAILKLRSSS